MKSSWVGSTQILEEKYSGLAGATSNLFKKIDLDWLNPRLWTKQVVKPAVLGFDEARYPIWGRSLIKNFGHVRDMVDF